ncbi:MAG: tRNA uridine-5-carboxymethylaminomethyl(34) synthesis GTPase MnmE [Duodenibacillus sp.]|nr:tRNA uridine-5-carboxymethylaminomethyl(34) synthesis GTPase MnmE [Duodenibacillus sp.]
MNENKAPIIARASAPGRGGVGIIRLSGSATAMDSIVQELFKGKVLKPRFAHLCPVEDDDGQAIDQAIVIRFVAPRSYTGEDVLEIQAHGGTAIQQMIMDRCMRVGSKVGLRYAEPGEFTQRAFLNGRIDLAQAEAVADLIDAGSAASARAAARSLQGCFSKRITDLNEQLIDLRAFVEATLDFPEEEIEFIENGHVAQRAVDLLGQVQDLSKSAMRGKVLRDGLTVVLVGSPNVGKSSLMNTLAGDEVAIVTDIAGTTRDKIEYAIEVDGVPIKLIDTAGLRQTEDTVEMIGIERTLKAIENADVILHLKDVTRLADEEDQTAMELILPRLREGVEFLTVVNKVDLVKAEDTAVDGLLLSTKTGFGVEVLTQELRRIAGMSEVSEGDFMARARHLDCIARAQEHLQNVVLGIGSMNLEIAAEELRLSSNALGEIVGQTLPDDLLGMIFSRFCIGK